MGLVKVANKKDLPSGKGMAVEVQGKTIALFNVNGEYYAMDDACTHAGGPLSEGTLEGVVVTCPWHGATFDVCSGTVMSQPAFSNVTSYKVIIEGEDIKIEV